MGLMPQKYLRVASKKAVSEWRQMSNCFSYIMARTCYFQWHDDDVRFVLDQHAEFDFHFASSLKQQSVGRHVAPLGHIILIPSQPVFGLSP
jgi:hypothetical protein